MENEPKKNVKSRLYKLGRNVFHVVNCSTDYIEYLDKLLPYYQGPALSDEETIEVRSGCSRFVGDVLLYVLPRLNHLGCAWLEAQLLISPTGQSVLIAGTKKAGRTTTAMALGLGYGWKVAGEKYLVFDYQSDKIVSYQTPFSFFPNTVDLLQRAIGRGPGLVLEPIELLNKLSWSPVGDMAADDEYPLKFELAVWLEGPEEKSQRQPLQVSAMSASEYFLQLMRRSNLLKSGASAKVTEALGSARCLRITGGELEERLDVITGTLHPKPDSTDSSQVTERVFSTTSV